MGRLTLVFFLLLMVMVAPAWADFQAGQEAYDRGDYATALKEWLPLAEQGDAAAQNKIGIMYEFGQGVTQRYAEAVRWYHKAAEQGDVDAQNTLGGMYLDGRAMPKDDAEAARWNRKAAEQGSALAQQRLGRMYLVGQGVPQDYGEALRWNRKAAEQGDANAAKELGYMYARGEGVPQDYVQAHMWFSLAVVWGHKDLVELRDIVAERYLSAADISKAQRLAREWLEALGPDHPKVAELRRLQLAEADTPARTPGCLAGATFGPIPEDSPWFGRVEGVQVIDVEPDSLASQMGLRKHDFVVEVNGRQVRDLDEFTATTRKLGGDPGLTLLLHRDRKRNLNMIVC